MAESGGRHVGMAQQVVRGAQQLAQFITADLDKVRVGVGDGAVEISGGEDVGVGAKSTDRPVIGRLIFMTGALGLLEKSRQGRRL